MSGEAVKLDIDLISCKFEDSLNDESNWTCGPSIANLVSQLQLLMDDWIRFCRFICFLITVSCTVLEVLVTVEIGADCISQA